MSTKKQIKEDVMLLDDIKGRRIQVTTEVLKKDDSSFIEVIVTTANSRTKDFINWETRKISLKAYGDTVNDAYSQATALMARYLDSVKHDLFSDPSLEPRESNVKTNSK